MKTFFINLPHSRKIIRRFKCSYNAPFFLLPPLELLYLASIARQAMGGEPVFMDSIAENTGLDGVIRRIRQVEPDLLITILGIESIDADLDCLARIKKEFPRIKIAAMGYLATVFPEDILKNSAIDLLLMNEPESPFRELLLKFRVPGESLYSVKGLAYRDGAEIKVNPAAERIKDLDELPFPAWDLLDKKLYREPYMGATVAGVLASRGCPFGCSYCVRTYGRKLYLRSVGNVVAELKEITFRHRIKNVRFMDDTFTADKEFVKGLCRRIIEEKIPLRWTCLSRIDTLDEELLALMKKSGCRRIYLGVESGCQHVLDYYEKGYSVDGFKKNIGMVKKAKIEAFGFMMVGAENESDCDMEKSIRAVKELDLDYVVLDILTAYPGTKLFEKLSGKVDFSLFPYVNRFKGESYQRKILEREKQFYREFYLDWRQWPKKMKYALRSPGETIEAAGQMLRHMFFTEKKSHQKYI